MAIATTLAEYLRQLHGCDIPAIVDVVTAFEEIDRRLDSERY